MTTWTTSFRFWVSSLKNNMKQECLWIWKLSADFTLIQCIKIVSIFLGRDMSGTTFLGSKLVSFNQTLVAYEISKISFQCAEEKNSCQYVKRDLIKFENSKIVIKSSLRSHINIFDFTDGKKETFLSGNNLIWCEYCNLIDWSTWRKFGYTR